jgi:hypothetical protein
MGTVKKKGWELLIYTDYDGFLGEFESPGSPGYLKNRFEYFKIE